MATKYPLVVGPDGRARQIQSGDTLNPTTLPIITIDKIEAQAIFQYNYLINGGFDYAQRQTPATLTTITADKYGPDRWRCHRQSADLQYRRYKIGDSGSSFTGTTASCYGRFAPITNTGKFLITQPIELVNSVPHVGRTVLFQMKMRADSARTFKIAIVEWRGTADVLTAAMVTSWNADGANPTLATNYNYGTVSSCSVTTSFQTFGVTATVSSSCTNLCCVVFSDSQVTASTGYLECTEAGIYDGSVYREWFPRLPSVELSMCERYFEKSAAVDVSPATGWSPGADHFTILAAPSYYGTQINVPFRTAKRVTPTANTYDSSGNAGKITAQRSYNWSANISPSSFGGTASFIYVYDSAVAAGSFGMNFGYTADAEL